MESTVSLTKMILEEAKHKAEHLIQDAKKSAKETLEKQRKLGTHRAKQFATTLLKKAENEAMLNKHNSIANAKIEANWIILSKKEAWIANTINEAKNKLKILTKTKEYIPILERLIIEAGIILKGKESEVILNDRDSALSLNFDKLAKEISKKTGNKAKLKLSTEKIQTIGGALLKTVDGEVIMDNTFEDKMKRREKRLRSKIVSLLF